MRVGEVIVESQRNKVILVDFQPDYSGVSGYADALSSACEYINRRKPEVLAFFNGMDVGIYDTEDEVYGHYLEYGLDYGANITFREKGYAFLRNWMDQGVSPSSIIKVLRYMGRNHINDSRDVDPEVLENMIPEGPEIYHEDMIYIPDIAINELKRFSNALLGGGGRSECLHEIQILMSAFNIRHKEVQQWIYG